MSSKTDTLYAARKPTYNVVPFNVTLWLIVSIQLGTLQATLKRIQIDSIIIIIIRTCNPYLLIYYFDHNLIIVYFTFVNILTFAYCNVIGFENVQYSIAFKE